MKNQVFKRGLPYFFAQQIHGRNEGNILELVIPHFKTKRGKDMLENILRWEDDGGTISEVNSSMLDQMFVQPICPAAHAQSVFRGAPGKGEPHA